MRQSAAKTLENLSRKDIRMIVRRLHDLEENPRPAGCEKLSVRERYRVRQGDYRIVYSIQDEERTVHVVRIGHRREVYR